MISVKTVDFLNLFHKSFDANNHLSRKILAIAFLKYFFVVISPQTLMLYNMIVSSEYEVIDNIPTANKMLLYLVTGLYLTPLLLVFDFEYFLSILTRIWISRQLEPEGTRACSQYYWMTQEQLNLYFEKPDCEVELKYLRNLSLIIFMGNSCLLAPLLASALIFLTILTTSVIELYLFYYRYKRSKRPPKKLTDHMIRRLILLPKIITYSVLGLHLSLKIDLYTICLFLCFVDFNKLLERFEGYIEFRLIQTKESLKSYSKSKRRFQTDYRHQYEGR